MPQMYGELIFAQLQNSASDLAPASTGLTYWNTTLTAPRVYDGVTWQTVALGTAGVVLGNVRAAEGGGTITLTAADNHDQLWDLNATEVVVLPTSTISKGEIWIMRNPNPFRLTIQASDASHILHSWGSCTVLEALINTPVTSADWKVVSKEILFGTERNDYSPTFPANCDAAGGVVKAWWVRETMQQMRVHVGIQFGAAAVASGTYMASMPSGYTMTINQNVLGSDTPFGWAVSFQSPYTLYGFVSWSDATNFLVNTTYNVTSFSASGATVTTQPILNAGNFTEFEAVVLVDEWLES